MAVDNRLPIAGAIGDRRRSDIARERLTPGHVSEDRHARTGADGRFTRLRDVARVELGALDYTTNGYLDGNGASQGLSNGLITVTLENIPFAQYDVYAYVGADQNGRKVPSPTNPRSWRGYG